MHVLLDVYFTFTVSLKELAFIDENSKGIYINYLIPSVWRNKIISVTELVIDYYLVNIWLIKLKCPLENFKGIFTDNNKNSIISTIQ